jgi:hypothetical protein
MPVTHTTLGYVLSHIYEIGFEAAIYLPTVEEYSADTPCIVAVPNSYTAAEEASLHQSCLDHGFKNWLNVAIVSDTCDSALDQTEASLLAAFNADCRDGGWLRTMMNYRNQS